MSDDEFLIFQGDCLEVLKEFEDNTFDSIVTDPPYGISFMAKKWDYQVPSAEVWAECLRVLKPGGYLLSFAGTRTQHRMCVNIEDGGFEIRDMIAWLYGSGFPKSQNVSKAVAKRAGGEAKAREAIEFMKARREELGLSRIEFEKRIFGRSDGNVRNWEDGISLPKDGLWGKIKEAMELSDTPFDAVMKSGNKEIGITEGNFGYQKSGERWNKDRVLVEPDTDLAKNWDGWGTALKPALEPITVARKPFKGTVAANVLEHGVGALNIDACRIPTTEKLGGGDQNIKTKEKVEGWDRPWMHDEEAKAAHAERVNANVAKAESLGRWPANVIHDGSEEVLDRFAEFGEKKSCTSPSKARPEGTIFGGSRTQGNLPMDSGTAARFFYAAKANKKDRGEGNKHPTVKPTELMRYLVRLVTPPGGLVLDPFAGSGSTGKAAIMEGFGFVGIEMEEEYVEIARLRCREARNDE